MFSEMAMKEKFDPINKTRDYIKYKIDFAKGNPDYFHPDGLILFVGAQGTGKTLSAVLYVYNLLKLYPKSILVTNLMLTDYPIVTFEEWYQTKVEFEDMCKYYHLSTKEKEKIFNDNFEKYREENKVFPFNNQDDLNRYNNGSNGVIFLIDEIQLYFNSLESKNINPEVMVQISQQRKQRKHIVATSQVFGRMAKPLREQFSDVVVCKNYLKFIQHNKIVNRDDIEEDTDSMHMKGKVKMKYWFIHSPMYYKRYDTYYTISRTKFVGNEKKLINEGGKKNDS